MFSEMSKKSCKDFESNEIDVREDEEQIAKFDEIIKMLVSAGYYRARIKGLENFDKIVGGMTWCIESCYFDVDVDLLFQENLTIGQKIALTEKIVVMLPKMKCPYLIEPHQIQGLDYLHIFPVIQWLVLKSMKTREDMAEYVQSFAMTRFDKKYHFYENQYQTKIPDKHHLITWAKLIKKTYEPRQRFKQIVSTATDEFSIINTLLEYGEALQISQSIIKKLQEMKIDTAQDKEITKDIIQRKLQEKEKIEELMKNLSKFDDNTNRVSSIIIGQIINIQVQEVTKAVKQYVTLSMSKFKKKKVSSACTLLVLKKKKLTLKSKTQIMLKEKEKLKNKLINLEETLDAIRNKKLLINNIFKKMKQSDSHKSINELRRLEELLIVHDGLNNQEIKFRDQCRLEMNILHVLIEKIQIIKPQKKIDYVIKYEELKEVINQLRLQVAKKNRAIAILTRQLDDIPGRSELTQYQRRFMELYHQVSVKHKETKQYYTLYNSLDDTKLYLSKELSLLNSIQDNYNEAMASASGKEQFIKQFELIINGIRKNKAKMEKRYIEEKSRRDSLSHRLVILMEQQRKYIAAVRQLTMECRKNETLLARLRTL